MTTTPNFEGTPNAEAIEAWNTVLFDKFTRFRPLVNPGLGRHGTAAIAKLAKRVDLPGKKVIDLGCGFGDTTQELAVRVGPSGLAFGIDGAARFIEQAKVEAVQFKNESAHYAVMDVETSDLGGPYDAAYARFGLMFCASPVQVFRNIRKSLKPDGIFCNVVWRKRDDNDWLHAAELIVRELVPEKDKGDQVTCGPGPFSMASADVVSEQMLKAGFKNVTFERNDDTFLMGSVNEAIDLAMQLGPAGEILRLAGDDGEAKRPEVTARLRAHFEKHLTSEGVVGKASTWIIFGQN